MSLRFPFQLHRLLTKLRLQDHLPRIRKRLRSDYNPADLTPDEALLIAASIAYDKGYAAYLLRTTGMTAVELVKLYPRRKARANWRRRLRYWLMSLEGSEPYGKAYARTRQPENRKDMYDDSTSRDQL